MCDILTEQLQHYTVLWRETSALYEEWAKDMLSPITNSWLFFPS